MAAIIHFDIPAENAERAQKFYQEVFDWKIEKLLGPMPYWLIETRDLTGEKSIGGGMSLRESTDAPGIINFIGVESLEQSVQRVEKMGGKIIQPIQSVPGWGRLVVCLDSEQNKIGLFEEHKSSINNDLVKSL